MKAEFQEQKAQIEKDFNRALLQMEKQYEDKLRKVIKQSQLKDYRAECH